MNCAEANNLIDPYVSRELSAAAADDMAAHIDSCAHCAAAVTQFTAMRIAARELRQPAPPEFRSRIRAALHDRSDARRAQALRAWQITALAASLIAVASVLAAILSRAPQRTALADELVTAHVRSLMADHLVDVASSDQHTVKPWFAGRIDFSPDVRDFASEGFPLVGGRLDYLNGRPVIALVYRHDKHVINAFTWPAGASVEIGQETRQGYHVLGWRDGEMQWSLISDAAEPTLQRLKNLIEQRPAATSPTP
jgi:anti-sigma factor RsiW